MLSLILNSPSNAYSACVSRSASGNSVGKCFDWINSTSLLEIPLFFAVVYGAANWFPLCIAKPYEWFLRCSSPVFTLIEGACVTLIIYCAGKYFWHFIEQRSTLSKIVTLVLFGVVFIVASCVILNIYFAISLSPVQATLIGSAVSLCLVLVSLSLFREDGAIVDGLLLYLYVVYNIWIISRSFVRKTSKFHIDDYSFAFSAFLSYFSVNSNLLNSFGAFLKLFSFDVVANILFRIIVFILAAKLAEKINNCSFGSDASFHDNEMTYNDLLFAFGKFVLVMIYTYSWLQECDVSIGSSQHVWRWLNVYLTLALFLRNFFFGFDFDVED